MILTKIQEEKLKTIEWLLSDDLECLGSGRTTVLAAAFLNKALANPNRKIKIFDHRCEYHNINYVFGAITLLLNKINEERINNKLEKITIWFYFSNSLIEYRG